MKLVRLLPSPLFFLSALVLAAVLVLPERFVISEPERQHTEVLLSSRATDQSEPQVTLLRLEERKQRDVSIIVDRPLFREDRRPQIPRPPEPPEPQIVEAPEPEPKPEPVQPRPAPPRFKLLGTHSDGSERRALIERPDRGQTWIDIGTQIDDWKVVQIESVRLELKSGPHVLTVFLEP